MTGYQFCVATGIQCMFELADARSEAGRVAEVMRGVTPTTKMGAAAAASIEVLLDEVTDAYDQWQDKVNKEIAQ